jgi:hypothetical protein
LAASLALNALLNCRYHPADAESELLEEELAATSGSLPASAHLRASQSRAALPYKRQKQCMMEAMGNM